MKSKGGNELNAIWLTVITVAATAAIIIGFTGSGKSITVASCKQNLAKDVNNLFTRAKEVDNGVYFGEFQDDFHVPPCAVCMYKDGDDLVVQYRDDPSNLGKFRDQSFDYTLGGPGLTGSCDSTSVIANNDYRVTISKSFGDVFIQFSEPIEET